MDNQFLKQCVAAEKVYRAINHKFRREILEALEVDPRTPSELVAMFDVTQPLMSSHLAILRDARLVSALPTGTKFKLYQFNTEAMQAVKAANDCLGFI